MTTSLRFVLATMGALPAAQVDVPGVMWRAADWRDAMREGGT